MELYPSINTIVSSTPVIVFDKIDGSNIRAEWTRKNGFVKFGTRKRLLDPAEEPLGEAVQLIMDNYAEDLNTIFRKQRFERTTAFFEFFGENSFAGFHEKEEHKVVLFDLHVYKQGLLPAKEFLKLVEGKVETPAVLHQGKITESFVQQVKNSEIEGMTFEGVVCKGGLDNRRRPVNFKIKSYAWLDKLKKRYGHNQKLYEQLK